MGKRIKVVDTPLKGKTATQTIVDDPPLRTSGAKLCAFCKHSYLRPCTEKTHKACPNWKHLQERKR